MRYPRVYFVLLTTGFMLIFGYSMLRSFLAIYAEQLDPTGVLVGFTISSYFFARTFIELPSGIISDRIGRSIPIVLGTLLGALGAIICAFSSSSIYVLIVGLMIWGLGAALVFTNNMALIIDLFEPQVRGRALGNFQGIEFIGSFAGAPIGGFLAELFLGYGLGYSTIFYVVGISILAAFLAAYASKELKKTGGRPGEGTTRLSVGETLKGLRNWGLFITCTVSFARMFIMQGVFSTVFPIYLKDFINISVGLIGIVLGVRTGGLIVATIASGHLSDRIGRKPVIIAGIFVEGLFIYLYTLADSFELISALAFFEGLGAGMISVTLIALMSEQVAPEQRGGAVGLYRTFMDVGAVVGPVVVRMVQLAFDMYACFYMSVALLLVNVPTLLTVRERRGELNRH